MKSLSMVIGAVLATGMLAPLPAYALTLTVDCNGGVGLYCNDEESSAVDVANLLGGTNCSGF